MDKLISPPLRERWLHAKSRLIDANTLGQHQSESGCIPIADLAPGDINKLLSFGYVEPLPPMSKPLGAVRVFTVLEKFVDNRYTRRRFLAVPDELNSFFQDPGEVDLPAPKELVGALAFEYARTGDFEAFFTQFPIPEEARDFYTFAAIQQEHPDQEPHVQLFRCTTICTGQRQCPCVAQCVAHSLASRAISAVFPRGEATTQADTYIDNVRISGPAADVEKVWVALFDEINAIGANFGQLSAGVSYEFLGIHFNHAKRTTSATPKSIAKLQRGLRGENNAQTNVAPAGLTRVGLFGCSGLCRPFLRVHKKRPTQMPSSLCIRHVSQRNSRLALWRLLAFRARSMARLGRLRCHERTALLHH